MKQCFKCTRSLPLSEFYEHPMMADGHLGKCKDCTKKDTAARVAEKMKDPRWVEQEMERHRIKQQLRRLSGRDKKLSPEKKREVQKRHREKYPDRASARAAVSQATRKKTIIREPCVVCGASNSQAHHDDYSKPLEVMWLCPAHHAARHVHLRRQLRMALAH